MNNPKTTFKKETKLQKINNLNNKIKKEKKEVKGGNGGFFTDLASFFKINENKTRNTAFSIPYQKMYEDGVCQINNNKFNKMIEFGEANYQLAGASDAQFIIENYYKIIRGFNADVEFQFVFMNLTDRLKGLEEALEVKAKDDELDEYRNEYRNMLILNKKQGSNGLLKKKYLVFTVKSPNLASARTHLSSIEVDLLEKFKVMKVYAKSLLGVERLETIHNFLNFGEEFNYKYNPEKEEDTRFFVAPKKMSFNSFSYFKSNNMVGTTNFLTIDTETLSDSILRKITEIEANQIFTIHIKKYNNTDALKKIKSINLNIQADIVKRQMEATQKGYDGDLMNPEIKIFQESAENLIAELSTGSQSLFTTSMYLTQFGKNIKEVNHLTSKAKSVLGSFGCIIDKVYDQEKGLWSCLPLGQNELVYSRDLITESLVGFLPFTAEDILSNTKSAIYYGINQLTNNLVMADRKLLKNPNGLILGVPGSGKSFASKKEIVSSVLQTDDDIIICDPECEYTDLVHALGGTSIELSPNSKHFINPMDITISDGIKKAITNKSEFMLSIFQVIRGKQKEIHSFEKTIIDRAIIKIYKEYFEKLDEDENTLSPTLETLYNCLLQSGEIGKLLALELEIYVHGSLNLFNHQTNIKTNNRLTSFNVRELGDVQKKMAMFIIQEYVWGKVNRNRQAKKSTRYYIDEFHLLLSEEESAKYSIVMWKLFRKYGGIPTGMTQNVKDLLASSEIENIFDNSDFLLLFDQSAGDRNILATKLNLSLDQEKYITNAESGCGIIKFGRIILPFKDEFPKDTKLYSLMTTRLEEK